jgi:hypothetical protein
VGENQSGIAKVIDRGELYDFLYKISDVLFDTHLQNFFYFFNKYMFGIQDSNPNRKVDANLPEINKPAFFDLSSVPEMTAEYDVAKKASMPSEYLRLKQIAIAAKEHSSNPDVKRKIVAILELDPLPEITAADMDMKLLMGTISKKDAVIHDNIGAFVDRGIREHKDFFDQPKNVRLEIMDKYAKEFMAANRITLTVEDDTEGTLGQAGRKVA